MRYSLVLYTVYTELCMVTFDKVCFDNVCLLRVFPMVETAKRCIYIGTAAPVRVNTVLYALFQGVYNLTLQVMEVYSFVERIST